MIIDGKSVFYRGYYAMGALSTSDGTPTGGIYGFAAIAMEIVRKLDPTKVVVAWDSRSSTAKRKEVYPEYKAGRTKPGDDFYAQIPLLEELVKALGWSFVECEDYEADDIIGTLALQADELTAKASSEDDEWETYIVSSDLDMLQIVDENTRMYRILKGFSQLEELDVAAVEAKYGIKKAQFLDLKALKGDASDNIPGVPGVGEKTAVRLLNEYGDLEGVYKNIAQITGAIQKKLIAGEESARMSYFLAKIMTDAPVLLSELPDLVIDDDKVVAALKKLEFKTLIGRFLKARRDASAASGEAFGAEQGELVGSFEYSGNVEGASGGSGGRSEGSNERSEGAESASGYTMAGAAERALEGAKKASKAKMAGAGGAFGQQTLEIPTYLEDGTLISWNVKDLMHKNATVATEVLKGRKFWDLAQGAFLLNPLASGVEYREELQEFERQKREFEERPELYKIFTQFDLPLIPVLYQIERDGMLIDRKYFGKLKREFSAEVGGLEQKIWHLAGREFNINSPRQLSEVLFTDLGLPTKGIKKGSRGYSTGVKELDKLEGEHEIIGAVKEYREAAKLLSTYIAPLPELADAEGRVHTTFNQNVTATGRLSSTNPNLQNIPVRTEVGRRIRTGFVAPSGKVLVSADYSQFELRLAAALAGDEDLIRDFNDGVDIHTKTAAEAFGVPMEEVSKLQRRAAKVINFGILYGMSVRGLAEAADMAYYEAKNFIENYFELRKPIKEYLEKVLKQAREQGYVETMFGRRRPTPDVLSSNFIVRTGAERAAQNMPIQGTEADLMKKAMIRVSEVLREKFGGVEAAIDIAAVRMVMQVHDSLIVECPEEKATEVAEILKREMEGVAPELKVRLAVDVSVGKNWGEL